MGRPREILKPTGEGEKILVHHSVKTRIEASDSELEGGKYLPKAKFDPQDLEWVD